MNAEDTKEILLLLANGIDYDTGELLAKDNILNRGDVVRTLFIAIEGVDLLLRQQRKTKVLPENVGKKWTEEDDDMLAKHFDSGSDVGVLAKFFDRTKGAISARLVKLGKISYRADAFVLESKNKNSQ